MFPRLSSSALALMAMTAPALADVTPEQVWQSWLDYYQSMGYSVAEGSREQAGGTLTLRDVVITGGGEQSHVKMSVPQVVLTDMGDGKVDTAYAEEMSVLATGTDPEGEEFSVPVTLKSPGNHTITSGSPEDMTHEFNYPTLTVVLTTRTVNGTEKPLPVNVTLTNTTGSFHAVAGQPAKYDYLMASEALSFDGDVTDDDGANTKFAGTIKGMQTKGSMVSPGPVTNLEKDMAAAVRAGLAMSGEVGLGATEVNVNHKATGENGEPVETTVKYDNEKLDLAITLSQETLGYKVGMQGIQLQAVSPQFPVPISYALASGALDLQLPVMQRDEAQPFRFAYSLNGLTISDEIWNLFDAQAALPRDPASLDIAVSGLMKVTRDIFAAPETAHEAAPAEETAPADDTDEATAEGMDPEAAADEDEAMAENEAMTDEMADEPSPFEPVEMTIDKLALHLLGASANATGHFKMVEGAGMEVPPAGELHAEFEGINKLIDTLGSMGLIPEDQMMGVRMMLAMFAKPVEGNPDKMTTDLEVKEDGSVFANGQQIK